MGQYRLQEENSVSILEECFELCQQHFYEVGSGCGTKPFDVDWDTLKLLLEVNSLSILTARVDGVVVGYFMNILTKDFLTSTQIAKELAIYVDVKYRGGRLFIKMVDEVSRLLRDKGITTHYVTFVHGHNEKLPLKLGYTPVETTYKKCLGVT